MNILDARRICCHDLGLITRKVVRRSDAVHRCLLPAQPGGALRADRRERLGQDHAAQHPHRRYRALDRHRIDPEEPEAGRAAPGPVRLRGRGDPGGHDDGQPRAVEGARGKGGAARGPWGRVRQRPVLRPRGDDRAARRLLGGGARGRDPRRARAAHGGASQTSVHAVGRIQAAGAARAGARRLAGRAVAGRADQPPGHPLHPLAGEVPEGLPGTRGCDLARPPVPGQHLHPHPGRGLPDGDAVRRQLRRLPARKAGGAGPA